MQNQENCKKQQHVHEITGSTRVFQFATLIDSPTDFMCK